MTEKSTRPAPRQPIRNIHIGDLRRYRLPVPGVVSILHRISGLGMFLFLPFVLWLFDLSLSSETSHDRLAAFLAHPLARLVMLGLAWALLHHLCAGIRFLLLDLHVGLDLAAARRGAWMVLAASLTLTGVVALYLLGAFA